MRWRRLLILSTAPVVILAAVFVMLEFLGTAVPVLAIEQNPVMIKDEDLWPGVKPTPIPPFIIYTTDDLQSLVQFADLSGAVLGEGLHIGKLKCNGDNCSQKMTAVLNETEYEYKFSSRQAFDEDARRLIVDGSGTMTSERQKERFTFRATFVDNGDGSFESTYVASRPDVSFRIPRTPGVFEIGR